MKTDIEIAQEAKIEPITSIAETLGITTDELELYGKYKAKLSEEYLEKLKGRPDGKLILVTAINPTPAGEGKTTTSVGLGQAFGRMGKKAVIALRETSLGQCFAIRLFRWKRSTCILPEIFMRSLQRTICLPHCWIIISNRVTSYRLIQDR